MVPTGSSLGLGDTIQDTGVPYGIDTERYTYCMVPTLTWMDTTHLNQSKCTMTKASKDIFHTWSCSLLKFSHIVYHITFEQNKAQRYVQLSLKQIRNHAHSSGAYST